jgi:hypothetical protein
MSKQATRRPQPKRRPQQRKGRTAMAAKGAKGGNNRMLWITLTVVLVVGAGLIIAIASANKKKQAQGIKDRQSAPAALVAKVTSGVSNDVINAVGAGTTVKNPLTPVTPAVPVLKDGGGKPRVVYMGAEYCPYCATERWAMVNALSRFGKFKNLKITTSGAAPEAFPNTATFSFYGSTYESPYIVFEPVEEQTNSDQPLETPTQEQSNLLAKYDVAPKYTDRTGAIPFMDFANQYIISGASYDAGKLSGLEHQQIADAMANSSTDISKGAVGTANQMTAAICKSLTNNKPEAVCSQPAIVQIQKTL